VAVVWVLLASALFGTTGTVRALGLPDEDPFVVGALRVAIGGLLLGAVALLRTRRRRPVPAGPVRWWPVIGCVAVGAAGVVAYQPTFFTGVQVGGVAVGTLIALGSAPVFTGLGGWLVLRQRPTARWWACTALALAGVVLLSGALDGAAGSLSVGGAAASLAAGASYAAYTLAVKGLLDRGWSTVAAVGAVFGAAGLLSAVELAVVGGAPLGEPGPLLGAVWLGVLTITVAYLLFARGLQRLPASTVSTLTLAEPLVAGLLGVVALHERLSPPALAGAVLLLLALALLGRRSRRGSPAPAAQPS
jgi:DME family drug/metabolite transporter